jgi:hypothetical protein
MAGNYARWHSGNQYAYRLYFALNGTMVVTSIGSIKSPPTYVHFQDHLQYPIKLFLISQIPNNLIDFS